MTAPLLEARGVSKSYGSVQALIDVSLSLKRGEVLAIVGDNGAGKSTLVKTLAGVHSPDAGTLLLEGTHVQPRSPQEMLRLGIETLYQDAGLAPHLSISANYYLGRELRAKGPLGRLGRLDERTMHTNAIAGLQALGIRVPQGRRKAVGLLSGGQRQAVAIGRAIAWARKVIILDEPTNHLGAAQSAQVLSAIDQARGRELGVIMISHSLPHVFEVADRVLVLRLGRVTHDRPMSQFDSASLVAAITGLDGPDDRVAAHAADRDPNEKRS